jgi:hypothetical protein
MAESQSTHSSSCIRLFGSKEKRDTAVDTALDAVDISLKLLGAAADFLPVAGVGTVVTVLQSMVTQIQVSLNHFARVLSVITDDEIEYTLK